MPLLHRFSIIAHSMGGIVTRLALGNPENSDLLNRLVGYVQIATPVLGSSTAYASLRRGPTFNPIFDWFRDMIHNMVPLMLHQLLDSLTDCDSIFQLLPPEKVLQKENGSSRSPFDGGVWPNKYRQSLDRAKELHASVQVQPQFQHHTILSDDIDTDYRYLVDLDYNILRTLLLAGGDGTVCEHSARYGSDTGRLVPVREQIAHDKRVRDINVGG